MTEETQMELPLVQTPGEMVQEFITAFGASKDPELWLRLVREEVKEFNEAFELLQVDPLNDQLAADLMKEACDVGYVVIGLTIMGGREFPVPTDMQDGVAWVLHVAQTLFPGTAQEAFTRVHASNMSKLGPDGKPIRREDGKVLKGPSYAPPQLIDLVSL